MKKNVNYSAPKKLLTPGKNSAKLAKNEKFNWDSYILYLSPYTQNGHGINICPKASKACIFGCLNTSGLGKFDNVQQARINKTNYLLSNRSEFISQLLKELEALQRKAAKGTNICVRLNGTSDLDFPKLIQATAGIDIFTAFPNIIFYDYTKVLSRLTKYANSRYHLTFSRSESNEHEVQTALNMGVNVAKVYNKIPNGEVTLTDYTDVFNGDESDLRFLDPKRPRGIYIGLKAKGRAKKDTSGFVVHIR